MTTLADEARPSNKARTLAWRDDVIRYARSRGIRAGRPLHSADIQDAGEVDGLSPWTLLCRRRQVLDLASAVRQARARADRDGNRYAAAVIYARGQEIENAYCVMPLSQLLDLVTVTEAEST